MPSDSFIDENIHPDLRPVDPRAVFLRRLREGSSSTSPAPSSSPQDDNLDTETPAPIQRLNLPTPQTTPLATFGNLVKRQVVLTEKSMVAFDQFLQVRTVEEQNVIIFAHLLQIHDMAKCSEKPEMWVIGSELGKKINESVQAFIYSPDLPAYRGLTMPNHILNAMRDNNVHGLPTEQETTQCDLVLSRISNKATHHRNVVKTAIKTSLDPKHETANRFVMRSYDWLTEETFWLKVDLCIEDNSKECSTADELNMLYNYFYEEDIKLYGDPADTPHKTVDFNTARPSWQTNIRKHSAKVQPHPKNAANLAAAEVAALAAAPAPKRRRIEMEEDGNDGAQSSLSDQ
ncbi:hypothetical protein C8R43DRAFT_1134137 [Mycena crocata]|nr:hypothetical protein C8R43DRAFT_1134137 [Mycena crocata]